MKNCFYVFRLKRIIIYSLILCMAIGVTTLSYNGVIETISNNRLLPIYSVETEEKKVALTFDCAWGAEDIPDILNTLENNNIKATFFLVGTWIDKYQDETMQIHEKGHDIGNHSNNHPHVNKLSYEQNIEDMKKCNEKIEKITGKAVTLYRSPYLEYNNTVISSAESLNMQVIQMDVDTLDYTGLSGVEMCARIRSKIKNGSIILMHNDTKYTASSLQQIIDEIKGLGYEIVPVSELVYKDNYRVNHEGRQLKSK